MEIVVLQPLVALIAGILICARITPGRCEKAHCCGAGCCDSGCSGVRRITPGAATTLGPN